MGQHRISFDNWKEARRKRALELKRQGWKQRTIAAAFGVSEATVSKWVANMDKLGTEAWRSKPYGHRPRKLREEHLQMIPELLSHGAEAYGFRGQLWTCARVRAVIGEEFGISYHKAHVSRLLKALNWTPQMPIERASQRDEDAIEKWRVEVWPVLKKKARQEGSIIVLIDEAGFYLLPGLVRTYAPRGQTPVLKPFLTYDHLSVMSGITMAGQLYTLVRDRALNSTDSVRFLKHLRHEIKGKLMVIWDGSPIHRKEVRHFMAEGGAKHIGLELLPAYAPDLNPAEGVWQQLKNVELRNVTCQTLPQLRLELALAIIRLRNKPHLVRAFFAGAGLSIET